MSVAWHIERFGEISSTQDLMKARAVSGAREGAVVVAETQSSGRGRHGREWISEAGNLYFSVLLKPKCRAEDLGQAGLVIGLALGEALQGFVEDSARIKLKWPNDVLLDGKKCAGILIEAELNGAAVEWIIIGVGVDIDHAPEDIGAALNDYTESAISSEVVLPRVLERIAHYFALWGAQGFDEIMHKWSALAHEQGADITVRIGEREERGTFYGVDEQGCLLLHDEQGVLKTISSGDVILCS